MCNSVGVLQKKRKAHEGARSTSARRMKREKPKNSRRSLKLANYNLKLNLSPGTDFHPEEGKKPQKAEKSEVFLRSKLLGDGKFDIIKKARCLIKILKFIIAETCK